MAGGRPRLPANRWRTRSYANHDFNNYELLSLAVLSFKDSLHDNIEIGELQGEFLGIVWSFPWKRESRARASVLDPRLREGDETRGAGVISVASGLRTRRSILLERNRRNRNSTRFSIYIKPSA